MKITYDPKAKAMYIHLTDATPYFGIVDHTQELTDDVLVDWLEDGTIYGIDILNVESKPVVSETSSAKRLTVAVHQFTEDFKKWVHG